MSLILRDQLLRECWVPTSLRKPAPNPAGPHYSVPVWGVIDDSNFTIAGETMFADVVAYWPALDKFTVTHQCRADEDADDHVVKVIWWQPLPPLPY
jgi:hypothetical protein